MSACVVTSLALVLHLLWRVNISSFCNYSQLIYLKGKQLIIEVKYSEMFRNKLAVIAVFVSATCGQNYNIDYCSSENTGLEKTENPYNAISPCSKKCLTKGYSVAVVQDEGCWCSDKVPENTTALSNCNHQCPGYPTSCGGQGYYGYYLI